MDIMSKRIHALRKENDMTLEALGNMVGVSKSTVMKWEKGDIANIKRDKIAQIAEIFHVSPAYLMGYENTLIASDGKSDAELVYKFSLLTEQQKEVVMKCIDTFLLSSGK